MIEVLPATVDRFDIVRAVLAPADPTAHACWCLSYRVPNAEYRALAGEERPARLRQYAVDGPAPGVVATVAGEPAGWCSVAPRTQHHRLEHSRTIPAIDDLPVWSIVCLVVRAPFRGQGVAHALVAGAVEHARAQGAPAVEAYPIESGDRRVGSALAFSGTTRLFEAAGFERVRLTDSTSGGRQRWVMRRTLD